VRKLSPSDLKEAYRLNNTGVDIWSLAQVYGVHYDTMKRNLRQYDLYGASLFSPNPQYVENNRE